MRCVRHFTLFCFLLSLAALPGCAHHQSAKSARQGKTSPAVARAGSPTEKTPGQSGSLIGMDEEQLVALLGPPTSEKDQAPGKIWRYRKSRCTVELTLYPDVQTRIYRALAY